VEGLRTVDGVDGEVGLRVGQQEQADPAHPQHPPGDLVGTVPVAQPAPHGAQHTAGQRKAGSEQSGHADVQAVFTDVVLHHPQSQRHIAAEHDAVVLAVLEHLGVLERLELVGELDVAGHPMGRIAVTEQPEQDHRAGHDRRVDLRHRRPAKGHQDHRRHELVDGRARIARAVDAHGHALLALGKPARHIRRADTERTPGQSDEQANRQEVPELGGIGHEPDGGHGDRHQQRHDNAAAVAVGPDAQRHTDQRAGQHRRGRQQAELGGVEVQHFFDRDADHAEHHPDHETDGEGPGADDQHRPRLAFVLKFCSHVVRSIDHGRNGAFSGLSRTSFRQGSGGRQKNDARQQGRSASSERTTPWCTTPSGLTMAA